MIKSQPFMKFCSNKFEDMEFTDFIQVQTKAEQHCNKSFCLKSKNDKSAQQWKLPETNPFLSADWMDNELTVMKETLNSVKAKLSDLDLQKWHEHTYFANPAKFVNKKFVQMAKPEFLTRAFLKLYEVLHAYPVIPEVNTLHEGKFESVHLCEAPGAFVVALNHYLSLHRKNIKWAWTGNTLNPYYEGIGSDECIADDRFISHTLDNWYFGSDSTGNLMSVSYLNEFVEHFNGRKVDLVTADGSIDCQSNPGEQESSTEVLHYCEVLCSFHILKEGGCLVVKKFTFFESPSINVLFLLCCVFEEVHIYKPITSKLGNSEVYVIAMGFHPSRIQDKLPMFLKYYGKSHLDKVMFCKTDLPMTFLESLKSCSAFFMGHQISAINDNLHLFNNPSVKAAQMLECLKEMVLKTFLQNNLVQKIPHSKRIVQQKIRFDDEIMPQMGCVKWEGYLTRKSKDHRLFSLMEQAVELHSFIRNKIFKQDVGEIVPYEVIYHEDTHCFSDTSLVYGKHFDVVNCSRFCNPKAVQILMQTLRESMANSQTHMGSIDPSHFNGFEDIKLQFSKAYANTVDYIHSLFTDIHIIQNSYYPHISSDHNYLIEVLNLMKAGAIPSSGIALLHIPLFTRMQFGIFLVMCSLFKRVELHLNCSESHASFIILSHPLPNVEPLSMYLDLLKVPKEDDMVLLQMFSVHQLVSSQLYSSVCLYNYLWCLFNVKVLQLTWR